MGIFTGLERRERVTAAASVATADGWLSELAGSVETVSGITVDERTALTFPAFAAGVFVVSEAAGSLPCKLYERRQPRGRNEVPDDPRYDLVARVPNEEMTAMDWRAVILVHLMTWGNHYSEIVRDGAGRVVQLVPLLPDRVTVDRLPTKGRPLIYRVTRPNGGQADVLRPEQIIHVKGPSLSGVLGLNPVSNNREAIGLGIAVNLFGAAFFGNGSWFGGFLEHPARLEPKAIDRIQSRFEKSRGVRKAGRLTVLEEGMKYNQVGIPPEAAQYNESRKFQVTEAARINRVPPHKVGDLERATFSNIEHQGIDFVTYSVRNWLVRSEQEFDRKLLSRDERRTLYFRHSVDALLRGDQKTRYEGYAIGRQWGWLSVNDIRELEDMNPLDGPEGNQYVVPLNMTTPATLITDDDDPRPGDEEEEEDSEDQQKQRFAARTEPLRRRFEGAYLPLLHRELQRLLTKEAAAIGRSAERHLPGNTKAFLLDAFDFYTKHRDFNQQVLEPVLRAFVETLAGELRTALGSDAAALARHVDVAVRETTVTLVGVHCADSRAKIERAILFGDGDLQAILADLTKSSRRLAEVAINAASMIALDLAWSLDRGTNPKETAA